MSDQFISKLVRDDLLQALAILVAELNHAAGLQVYEMIVMGARHFLVARPTVPEIMPGENVRLLEQPNRAIHGRYTDVRIDGSCAPVYLLDIGMVGRFG